MDYKKHYENLINNRKKLNRSKSNGFYEWHHIQPKCIGGTDEDSNLVLLTPKEHYIAHLLLIPLYDGREKAKLTYAFLMMCACNQNQTRKISSKQYESAKKMVSNNCSGINASFYGKKLSEDAKKKLSERMKGENNPSKKYGAWNKNKTGLHKHSKETKEKIRQANLGRIFSNESKLKMSLATKGKPKSEEHKRKLSEANKGKKMTEKMKAILITINKGSKHKIVICPRCNKSGGHTAMHRWHFNNCKY